MTYTDNNTDHDKETDMELWCEDCQYDFEGELGETDCPKCGGDNVIFDDGGSREIAPWMLGEGA
jgi:Zn finger protein HypA/HybF involved in hydrogenase expression